MVKHKAQQCNVGDAKDRPASQESEQLFISPEPSRSGALVEQELTCYWKKLAKREQDQVQLSLVVRKPVFGVFDQVRYKAGCTAIEIEDG